MDILTIILLALLVITFAGSILLVPRFAEYSSDQLFRGAVIRKRTRHEVHVEFEQRLSQSSGFRKWWLF
jgi:hypothetical protein